MRAAISPALDYYGRIGKASARGRAAKAQKTAKEKSGRAKPPKPTASDSDGDQ